MIEVRFGTVMEATFTPLDIADAGFAVVFTGGEGLELAFSGRFPEASTCVLASVFDFELTFDAGVTLAPGLGAGLLVTLTAVGLAGTTLVDGVCAFITVFPDCLAGVDGAFTTGFAPVFFAAGLIACAFA